LGEIIYLPNPELKPPHKSLSLELRLEARKLDDYGDIGPVDLVAKTEYYIELEQTDLTPGQSKDVQSILNYLLSEMEMRQADGVAR
jgi:hypothetical protein